MKTFTPEELEEILRKSNSPKQLAAFWGVSRKTILRAIRSGDLPSVRIGTQSIRILKVDASAYYLKKSRGVSPVVPGSPKS